jgi:uncharacterized protein
MEVGTGVVKQAGISGQPAMPRAAAVVTGASSGIGRALAQCIGREMPVLLVARSAEPMRLLAADIAAAGGTAEVLVLDITVPDAAERIAVALAGSGLFCQVLVNNAGYGLVGEAAKLDGEDQTGIIDLNISALARLSLAVLPDMLGRGAGGILNVASVASFTPGPGMAMYYASKAFVRTWSEALWQECRGTGVTVSALCPGPVSTGFFGRATGGAKKPSLFKLLPGTTADDVARAGWRAFRARKRVCIPGWTNKLTVLAVLALPNAVVLPLVARLQKARRAKEY